MILEMQIGVNKHFIMSKKNRQREKRAGKQKMYSWITNSIDIFQRNEGTKN